MRTKHEPRPVRLDSGVLETPIGTLRYVSRIDPGEHTATLCAVGFEDGWERLEQELQQRFGRFEWCERSVPDVDRALRAYFVRGDAGGFAALATDPGGTPFQRRVWQALCGIEAGQTCSYAALARRIGRPGAQRAVGAANGRNPLSLVVPCHRVIAADGSLGGYAFGVERKRWLLEHERTRARRLAAHRRPN